jgi:hypothetical protein
MKLEEIWFIFYSRFAWKILFLGNWVEAVRNGLIIYQFFISTLTLLNCNCLEQQKLWKLEPMKKLGLLLKLP